MIFSIHRSRLALPAAALGLLPVGHGVALRLSRLPAPARRFEGGRVIAIEQIEAPLVAADADTVRAVAEKQEGGAVGIFVVLGKPDRLRVRRSVLRRAVRQPGVGIVRPQMCGQRLDPLRLGGDDHGALARRQRFFQQLRQRLLQGRALQMVEGDVRHVAPRPCARCRDPAPFPGPRNDRRSAGRAGGHRIRWHPSELPGRPSSPRRRRRCRGGPRASCRRSAAGTAPR